LILLEGKKVLDFEMKLTDILRGGGNQKIVIPDYKIYQVNEHTPELQALEKKLAERGLKDPWIRNEVWRYDMRDRCMTNELKGFHVIFRGFIPGLILAVGSAFLWWEYDKRYLSHHHHDDHH